MQSVPELARVVAAKWKAVTPETKTTYINKAVEARKKA